MKLSEKYHKMFENLCLLKSADIPEIFCYCVEQFFIMLNNIVASLLGKIYLFRGKIDKPRC